MDFHWFAANRNRPKAARYAALRPHIGLTTVLTAQTLPWLLNAKDHHSFLEGLVEITIADETERMIQ
jgi:hypothetical protein